MNPRQRLILLTLTSTPIVIEDIRADETWPGLRPYEVSFLRLLEKISDDCVVKINETGTKLTYEPGIVNGGKHLVHDCDVSRSIGYFLEPLFMLGLFGKKPLSIRLKARGIFNRLLLDVHIFTDHKAGAQAGKSPGYGISLVAETTIGCFISADTEVSYARGDEEGEIEDEEKKELMPPVDGLLFILCALCPQDVSKVRVGKLSPYGIETLRNIRDFLGVKFVIKPDPSTGTVTLKCVGCGLTNLSRNTS
ncbi:putative RNA 3'-terminal phosphate cyclase-like protein [Camellia lanceoleosa]|uniref:RNA 3'-terminal phosphate cyclase-like protein n=1 Tax=Camellia lanceoleosa TaxID=1840588 RepID=A0ACC0GZD0_9ERIC|nr:putative RNA 3'-terminal phosphate cyclase-like protein [Camellia lanceoleosa]